MGGRDVVARNGKSLSPQSSAFVFLESQYRHVLLRQRPRGWTRPAMETLPPRVVLSLTAAGGETLLDSATIASQDLLKEDLVAEIWRDHLARRAERHPYLWNVLMFQAWLADARSSMHAPRNQTPRYLIDHA